MFIKNIVFYKIINNTDNINIFLTYYFNDKIIRLFDFSYVIDD